MTAKELHILTAQLFEKHPSAKSPTVDYFRKELEFMDDALELIIQGHLAEWILTHPAKEDKNRRIVLEMDIVPNASEDHRHCVNGCFGRTILHALVAACMEIEK